MKIVKKINKDGKSAISHGVLLKLKSFAQEIVKTKGGDFDTIYIELRRLYKKGDLAIKQDEPEAVKGAFQY